MKAGLRQIGSGVVLSASALSLAFVGAPLAAAEPEGAAPCQAVEPAIPRDQADPTQTSADDTEQEIVVTAQRRTQRLDEIPMSVTAITASDIKQSGADSLEDLQFEVPGFSLVSFSAGAQQYQLRGVSSNSGLPTVGVYLDEIPINADIANAGLDINLRDLERVEVLRGPQGTLYGEGSMGGTIRYITRSPDLETFGGEFGVEAASIADGGGVSRLNGVINLPIATDTLGLRIAATYEDNDGWIDNSTLGIEDTNSGTRLNVRGKLLWQASPDLRLSLLYTRGENDFESSTGSVLNRQSSGALLQPNQDEYDLWNGIVSYDFDGVRLLSSTGYIERSNSSQFDLSPALVPLLELLGFPPGFITGVGATSILDVDTFTQELRLSSLGEDRFRWTLGAYYRDYRSNTVLQSFEQPNSAGFTLIALDNNTEATSWAVFGEASYDITDRLEASLGLRYYEDERRQSDVSTNFGFDATDLNQGDFDSLNPRLALLYRTGERSSLYLNIAKGFRSGGFNLQSAGGGFPIPPSYVPENLWSYEVGGVWTAADNAMQLQWAVYYNDWSDVQTFNTLPGSPVSFIVNGGAASGFGVDLQASYRPTDRFELSASVGWNNMEYDSTTADHLPGDPMDYVSPLTGSLTATQRFDWSASIEGYVRADWQYTDAFDINIRDQLVAVSSEARSLARLSLGANVSDWDAEVFADNLFDEDAVAMPAFGSLPEPIRTLPRTIGVSLNRRF